MKRDGPFPSFACLLRILLITGYDRLMVVVTETHFMKSRDTDSFTVTVFIMMGFSFVSAAWIAYVVRERENKCKNQQVC